MAFTLNDSPFTPPTGSNPFSNERLDFSTSFDFSGLITGDPGEVAFVKVGGDDLDFHPNFAYNNTTHTLSTVNFTSSTLTTLTGLKFAGATTVDTIETALTNDDTHLPTSGAVYDAITTGAGAAISGTPVDNQVAVWTNATTIEGTTNLTFDTYLSIIQNTSSVYGIKMSNPASGLFTDSTGIYFDLYNSNSAYNTYGGILTLINSAVAGSETGIMYFYLDNAGSFDRIFTIFNTGARLTGTLNVDTITEFSLASGVTIEGVLLENSTITIGSATISEAELEILDGATVTTTELNVLAGIPGTLTSTELGYVDGVTSAIQTQLNLKAPLAGPTFTGNVSISNAMFVNVTTVNAATYDVLTTDNILHVTRTATGVCAIDLKTAQLVAGRLLVIKDAGGNASVNNITITTQGAETIDGAATAVINSDYSAINIYSDSNNWFIY